MAISLGQWCQHRLASVRMDGPMDRAGVVLALALQYCTDRIHSAGNIGEQGLVSRVGTTPYHKRLRSCVASLGRWCGPPTFSISASFDPNSPVMLATSVSHTARVEGRREQVWHRRSEEHLLNLRPGREEDRQQGSFFVHCESQEQEDSCPYHTYCSRQSVEEWRQR